MARRKVEPLSLLEYLARLFVGRTLLSDILYADCRIYVFDRAELAEGPAC
jgi:hypothetical protein